MSSRTRPTLNARTPNSPLPMNMARGRGIAFGPRGGGSCGVAGGALERQQPGRRGEVKIQGEDRVA